MITAQCIPEWSDRSLAGLESWWQDIASLGLIFHPDDAPEEIVTRDSGQKLFKTEACIKLKSILFDMFSLYGDAVYDASHAALMEEMGWLKNNQDNGWIKQAAPSL